MSAAEDVRTAEGCRWLTFEVSQTVYALPITEVLEVVESAVVSCVPTLPRDCGGVMNWHGEALPVVAPHLLLGGNPAQRLDEGVDRQFLVVTDRPEEPARFGLPIDTVVGLVDGEAALARGPEVVVERRPVDGRVVSVVNPQRLVARAAEVIESSVV